MLLPLTNKLLLLQVLCLTHIRYPLKWTDFGPCNMYLTIMLLITSLNRPLCYKKEDQKTQFHAKKKELGNLRIFRGVPFQTNSKTSNSKPVGFSQGLVEGHQVTMLPLSRVPKCSPVMINCKAPTSNSWLRSILKFEEAKEPQNGWVSELGRNINLFNIYNPRYLYDIYILKKHLLTCQYNI